METLSLTADSLDREVSRHGSVLIEFFSPSCAPCNTMSKIISSLKSTAGGVTVGTVNIASERELAERFGILSVPTLIFFKNGQLTHRSVGLISKEKLIELINENAL